MTCSFEPCERPVEARGLCHSHFAQQRRGKELTIIKPRAPKGRGTKIKPGVTAEIRQWAREHGYDVPKSGRIPWQIKEDWLQATENP